MNFFIKRNSTLPLLIFPITDKLISELNLEDEMFSNVAITFSMINAETNAYKIANRSGDLFINSDISLHPNLPKFSLVYKFTEKNTSSSGLYLGEFVIDFLDNKHLGKIKLPIDTKINIVINDTITKTTVI